MIIDTNKALITHLAGPLGAVRFQRYYRKHLARAPWTNTAPVTDAQAAHRLAVARSSMLYGSIRALLAPAWAAYAPSAGYGPFACWQALNILACKAGSQTTIAPPNALWTPLTAPAWSEDVDGQARATWTSPDPPGTATVFCWQRLATEYAWTLAATVDASADLLTVTGLPFGLTHELAIAARSPATGAWSSPLHCWHTRTTPTREDFDTYTQLDPDNDITTANTLFTVTTMKAQQTSYAYRDLIDPSFAPGFEHRFTLGWTACQTSAGIGVWCMGNTCDSLTAWSAANAQAVALSFDYNGSVRRANFKNFENGSSVIYTDYSCPATYYITVDRPSETSLRARVYTNPTRTTLKHTHTITCASGRRYRYYLPCSSKTASGTPYMSYTIADAQLWPFA